MASVRFAVFQAKALRAALERRWHTRCHVKARGERKRDSRSATRTADVIVPGGDLNRILVGGAELREDEAESFDH
jgi:hypothetical protein